jgi:hypothetical protein
MTVHGKDYGDKAPLRLYQGPWKIETTDFHIPSAPAATASLTEIQNRKEPSPVRPTFASLQAHPSIGKDYLPDPKDPNQTQILPPDPTAPPKNIPPPEDRRRVSEGSQSEKVVCRHGGGQGRDNNIRSYSPCAVVPVRTTSNLLNCRVSSVLTPPLLSTTYPLRAFF